MVSSVVRVDGGSFTAGNGGNAGSGGSGLGGASGASGQVISGAGDGGRGGNGGPGGPGRSGANGGGGHSIAILTFASSLNEQATTMSADAPGSPGTNTSGPTGQPGLSATLIQF